MSFSRKTLRLLIAAFAFLVVLSPLPAQTAEKDDNALLVQVLEGYQNLMLENFDEGVEDIPGKSWALARQAISEGYLRFTVDPGSRNLLDGARFNAVRDSSITHIIISARLLEVWEERPSLVYSIFTRAVREAANFFLDPQAWGRSQSDLMDRFLLTMDGYGSQADLIRDRLMPLGYLLTPYETFIMDSFEKDQMQSVAMHLEGYSLLVAQGLYQARIAFENDNDADTLRELILTLGNTLLKTRNDIPADVEDKDIQPVAVAIHTWLEFTPEIIARIYNRTRQENPLSFDQILAREPDYAETRRLLEASRTEDMPMLLHFARETAQGFERY